MDPAAALPFALGFKPRASRRKTKGKIPVGDGTINTPPPTGLGRTRNTSADLQVGLPRRRSKSSRFQNTRVAARRLSRMESGVPGCAHQIGERGSSRSRDRPSTNTHSLLAHSKTPKHLAPLTGVRCPFRLDFRWSFPLGPERPPATLFQPFGLRTTFIVRRGKSHLPPQTPRIPAPTGGPSVSDTPRGGPQLFLKFLKETQNPSV